MKARKGVLPQAGLVVIAQAQNLAYFHDQISMREFALRVPTNRLEQRR